MPAPYPVTLADGRVVHSEDEMRAVLDEASGRAAAAQQARFEALSPAEQARERRAVARRGRKNVEAG